MEKISSAHTIDQATRANLVKTAKLIYTNDTVFELRWKTWQTSGNATIRDFEH